MMNFTIRSDRRNDRSIWLRAALSCGCAAAALTASTAASAQEAAAAAAGDEAGVEEIVATAQRRTERLENVPMAVTALSSAALDRANVTGIQELGRITPGVQINFGGVSTQPAIRGVTSLTNGVGNENNVAVYVDGFYAPDNQSINMDLANLQGIQVLKGPQGTLYGRNATGGAILIQTLDPSDELSGKFEGSYGRFSERKLTGYLSAPLSDKVGFIVAGTYRNSDGWIGLSDPANNQRTRGHANPIKQRALRAKLKAELTDNLKATLAYNYSLASDPSGLLFTPFEQVSPLLPNDNRRAVKFGTASSNYKQIASGEVNEGTLKIEWQTPIGTLTSYSGYAKRHFTTYFDFDGTYADLTFSGSNAYEKTKQQAIDLAINAIDHVDLVVGAFYYHDRYYAPLGNITYGPGQVVSARNIRALTTEAYAFYADATWHITDKLSIGAGGRYSHDDRDVSQTRVNGAGALIAPLPYSKSASFSKFTPRATIRYEIAQRSNVYASYSKGFRAGSFTSSPQANPALDLAIKPEQIDAYEIGFKTAQRLFRFEIAGFYYDYKDLNVSLTVPDPTCPAGAACAPVLIVGNAPKAKIKGIDASLSVTPVERLNITVGGAWLHARYGKFPNAVGTGLDAATGLNVGGQTQDWSGKQMSRAPNLSGNLNVDYTVPLGDNGDLRLSGNVQYTDGYVISNPSLYGPLAGAALADKQRFRQGAYALVNGEITWTSADQHYWIGVFGKNLTNKSYRLTYNGSGPTFGSYSTKAAPITYGVKAGYKF
jgi:iron complex outermembrane receptor protein